MKKRFTIGGAIAGLIFISGAMVFAFVKAPGHPGIFELLLLAAFVVGFVVAGAFAGLLLGWLVSLCLRKK